MVLVKDSVEEVTLLSAAVQNVWLTTLILAFYLNAVKNELEKEMGRSEGQECTYKQLILGSNDNLILVVLFLDAEGPDSNCHNHILIMVVLGEELLGSLCFLENR